MTFVHNLFQKIGDFLKYDYYFWRQNQQRPFKKKKLKTNILKHLDAKIINQI